MYEMDDTTPLKATKVNTLSNCWNVFILLCFCMAFLLNSNIIFHYCLSAIVRDSFVLIPVVKYYLLQLRASVFVTTSMDSGQIPHEVVRHPGGIVKRALELFYEQLNFT